MMENQKTSLIIISEKLKKIIKKVFFYLGIFAVFLFIVYTATFIFRPVFVIDSEDHSFISDASVTYSTVSWAEGCHPSKNYKTHKGVSLSFFVVSPCEIKIEKDGYYTNGARKIKSLPGLFGVRIISLNKIKNQQPLVKFEYEFPVNTRVDVLSYLNNPDSDFKKEPPDEEYDFIISPNGGGFDIKIIDGKELKMLDGNPTHSIKFNGEGGIMQISNNDMYSYSFTDIYYEIENLLIAPESGYQKEVKLAQGRGYVAKLRDGKHFIVFYVSAFSGNVEMTGYIQPKEGLRNLEFIGKGRQYPF